MPMNFKKCLLSFTALLLAMLLCLGGITAVIDPFFHYHAPLPHLQYDIFYQRYQNDGILKHFDYDAVITGNSLSENFKASRLDRLFGVHSVKVPFSGASLKELDLNLRTAFSSNPNIKLVVMNLDYGSFIQDKDTMNYDADDYPNFLYNANPFDDVKYIFNKDIFVYSLNVIKNTLAGKKTTSFDAYSAWPADTPYGLEAVLSVYDRPEHSEQSFEMNGERMSLLEGNISQNILETVNAHPDTEFYFFFPPYSIFFWDRMERIGELSLQLEAERAVIEMLMGSDNVHLFSFMDEYALVTDPSRYKDTIHYDSGVSEWMLDCMAKGEHRLTRENYESYLEKNTAFYTGYDYEGLFA